MLKASAGFIQRSSGAHMSGRIVLFVLAADRVLRAERLAKEKWQTVAPGAWYLVTCGGALVLLWQRSGMGRATADRT